MLVFNYESSYLQYQELNIPFSRAFLVSYILTTQIIISSNLLIHFELPKNEIQSISFDI